MFTTYIPYEEYNTLEIVTDKNQNDFITGNNIIIPCIKEKMIDFNNAIDTQITQLFQNDIIIATTQSQIIEPQITL